MRVTTEGQGSHFCCVRPSYRQNPQSSTLIASTVKQLAIMDPLFTGIALAFSTIMPQAMIALSGSAARARNWPSLQCTPV